MTANTTSRGNGRIPISVKRSEDADKLLENFFGGPISEHFGCVEVYSDEKNKLYIETLKQPENKKDVHTDGLSSEESR